MDLSNCLYYTFSTISQTLAAALGLLTGVVLFRLDKLNRTLDAGAENILNQWRDREFYQYFSLGHWGDFLRFAENHPAYKSETIFHRHVENIKNSLAHIPGIKEELLRSIIVTCVIIVASISILGLTPLLEGYSKTASIVLLVGIGSVIFALYRYYRLIQSLMI